MMQNICVYKKCITNTKNNQQLQAVQTHSRHTIHWKSIKAPSHGNGMGWNQLEWNIFKIRATFGRDRHKKIIF